MATEATFGNRPNLDIDIQYLPMIKELILTAMNLGTVNSLPGEDIALIKCQLTSLRLDNAKDVTIHKCNQLTSVDLPSATTVNISDCSALQTVNLPYARQANFYRLPNLPRLDSTHVPTIIRLGFKTTQPETNFDHEPVRIVRRVR